MRMVSPRGLRGRLASTRLAGPALLLGSRYTTSIVGPLVSLLVVRYLGPEMYGVYASATAVTALFNVLTDFGLQQAALEAAAVNKYPLSSVLRGVIRLGAVYTFIAYGAVTAWVIGGGYERTVVLLALYTALGYFQTPLLSAVTVGLQTKGLYSRIALWNWALSTARWVGTLAALLARASIFSIVVWPLILAWAITVAMIFGEAKRLGLGAKFDSQPPVSMPLREFFARSWRFGSAGMMHQLYHRADSALLSLMRNPVEVGHYAVAFRVIELLNAFPGIVFNQVLYPKYFQWFKVDRARVQQYYQMTSKWMLAIGAAGAVLVSLFSRDMIGLVFGSQQEGAAAFLVIMAWAVPARFLAASAGALLTTSGLIDRKLGIQTTVAIVTVGLNVVLIPSYGGLASSAVMVVTDSMLVLLYVVTVRTALTMRAWDSTRQIMLAAALVSACLAIALRSPAGFVARLATGSVVLAGALGYAWLALTHSERTELRRLLARADASA